MNQQTLIFEAEDLLPLLTHYTEGAIPLDARLLGLNASPFLERWIGLEVESSQWDEANLTNVKSDGASALHIRYEGNKILKLGKATAQPEWVEAPEGRNRS